MRKVHSSYVRPMEGADKPDWANVRAVVFLVAFVVTALIVLVLLAR